jgi:rhodanese-related sulfurtransferase
MVMETMNRPKTRLSIALFLSALLVVSLSACAPAKLDVSNVTAIIDTRSASDYSKSHIAGAINIGYVSGSFIGKIIFQSRKGIYYLYGTTADEAGQARNDMLSLGFKNVTNLGNIQDAQNVLPLGLNK